jgi:hypothetical protein
MDAMATFADHKEEIMVAKSPEIYDLSDTTSITR